MNDCPLVSFIGLKTTTMKINVRLQNTSEMTLNKNCMSYAYKN